MADRVGQQLGHYRLARLLGVGGFAEVYLGEHIYLDTPAAIKVLHAQLAEEDVEHFRTEARTIARLVHPHIVRVLDYGLEGTTPFLVMDYAPNGTLRKRYARGTILPLAAIVNYVSQVAAALDYAHQQKVIHRDVKPENMLLGRHDEVLLSDFGIALMTQSTHLHGPQGIQEMAGTIAYMAPEQIQAQAGPNSDQYSLAVVVYEWLSGERPFQGAFTEVAVKHMLAPPPPLRKLAPAVPSSVEAVVMQALHKDPARRFPDVQTFAAALEHASRKESQPLSSSVAPPDQPLAPKQTISLGSQAEALLTTPIPPPAVEKSTDSLPPASEETFALNNSLITPQFSPHVQSKLPRRAIMIGMAGAVAAGVIGGSIGWLRYTHISQGPSTTTAPDPTLYIYRGHSDRVWSAGWSPNARRIASASGDATVQVWDATSGDHLTLYNGHTASVYALCWSPDGRRIASGGYDKTVQVWDATFGDHFYTCTGHSDWVWSVAWSPDGRYLASGSLDKTVQVWDAANGSHLYTYPGHSAAVHAVAWSPDGKHIASASQDGTVQVWNPFDGQRLYTYYPPFTAMWSVAWSPDGKRIASASDNKTVQIWDAANGGHLFIYTGHADFVYTVAWSPDGKQIASAGDDRTVQIWSPIAGKRLYTYTGHSQSVRSVAWSPAGGLIASASWDKTVRVWRAQ